MNKMNIAEAAEYFKVSKEAIHNRIRRGSLDSVVEDNIKYVLVDENSENITRRVIKKSISNYDEKYYTLLEEQNAKLQDRVEILEGETRLLRDQKEQMLIDERKMIEQIYKEKDEQLKNILNSFKAQFIAPEHKEPEHLEAEIEDVKEIELDSGQTKKKRKNHTISLKKYLKKHNFSPKKEKKIKAKFKKYALKDKRIITIDDKYYLNLKKFDYSDILLP
jgi:hypothetical protein